MKKAISYVLSFVLVLMLLSLCLLAIVKSTILDEKYMISKLEEANYYERMNGEIIEQFKNYTIQSGLSDEVLENLFTEDKLKQDINNVIDSIYTGKELEISTSEIRENLKENILAEVEKEGKTVDFEDEAMEEYLKAIESAYESQVSYSTSTINSIGSTFEKVISLAQTAQIIVIVVTIVIAVLIIILNIKQIFGLNYLAISSMATGLFILIAKFLLGQSTDLKNIMLINQATSHVIQLVIEDLLAKVTIAGVVLLIIGLIFSIIYNLQNKKYFEKNWIKKLKCEYKNLWYSHLFDI